MRPNFSKLQMKDLRRLAEAAYDRELAAALDQLEAHFRRWRAGEISPHDLSLEIHNFHDGISRELWNMYGNLNPDLAVARAIASGLIKESEVNPEIYSKLAALVDFVRKDRDEPAMGSDKQEG